MWAFPYVAGSDSTTGKQLWMPYIPVHFRSENKAMFVPFALIDTGASYSVLPVAYASRLGVDVETVNPVTVSTANGEMGIYRSSPVITCVLRDLKGGQDHAWETELYFSENAEVVILGHRGFLEKFDVTLRGSEKKVEMEWVG